ncbi:electron transport complex subunit RsxC [Shewanella colwelliana]|uniref:electron transport complex subunit RsxC n=1 Tax=Shewanella colwelliana TaxID=23 RepID=UPI00373546D3
MLTLFEQIDKGTLWKIPGGIHPPECKTLSSHSAIARLAPADHYIIPVPQAGDAYSLTVDVGQNVLKGQALTHGEGFRYLPVHTPVSGKVIAIEERPSNHASGLPVLSCVIENDKQDTLVSSIHARLDPSDVVKMDNEAILSRIQQAGIAGLGGAAFPTHIKLKPVSEIELLIINGVECEPFITSDDRLMQEHCDEIVSGITIIHQLLSPKRIVIAIEDNKPQASEQMRHALNRSTLPSDLAKVTVIPTLYPSGGEKQLIQILTGQEVPSGSIPAQLGILVQNVGTAFAIDQAVYCNMPLIERVVTLTGSHVGQAGNYWLPIGTPIDDLLGKTQYLGNDDDPLIIGGPMMGYMLPNRHAPVLKGTNCVLMPTQQEIAPERKEQPCIRCGECAVACPAQLLPQQLFWHAKAQEYDKAAGYNLRDCIECGCCSYVCPSDIPLVEYYRVAKSALKVEAEEKKQAELAKQRFDSRTLRLEEEKRAREEKAKQAANKRKAAMSNNDKDAVAEAMARIKAKKAATQTENVSDAPQDKVAAAIARAKAKKQTKTVEQTENSVPTQQEKVAAAVARAKAKKLAQSIAPVKEPATETPDPREEKVAAAIARAKAKKAQQTATNEEPGLTTQQEKVAAAIARAKAKKAAKAQESRNSDACDAAAPVLDAQPETISADEAKKAKIAAAVAKAKAKKRAQAQSADAGSANAETSHTSALTAHCATDGSSADVSLTPAQQKQAKIAAAVAKAKAKKLAQQSLTNQEHAPTEASIGPDSAPEDGVTLADAKSQKSATSEADEAQIASPAEIKKAKIAAAVAKAKAKKLTQESMLTNDQNKD